MKKSPYFRGESGYFDNDILGIIFKITKTTEDNYIMENIKNRYFINLVWLSNLQRVRSWKIMTYNIISTEDYAGSQELELIQNGNKYIIELYNRETKECVRISLKNIEQATTIYNKFVDFMIRGHYSFEQRANILKRNKEDIQTQVTNWKRTKRTGRNKRKNNEQ